MRTKRQASDHQETSVAKQLGLRKVSGSGSSPFEKGDVKGDDILIECKTKVSPSKTITVHKEWLTKLRTQAIGMGKGTYALAINFGDEENYYILTSRQMQEYLHLLGKENED